MNTPDPRRVARLAALRRLAVFQVPPAMLAEFTSETQRMWCEGLLHFVEQERSRLGPQKGLAAGHLLARMRTTIEEVDERLTWFEREAKKDKVWFFPFRYTPYQDEPEDLTTTQNWPAWKGTHTVWVSAISAEERETLEIEEGDFWVVQGNDTYTSGSQVPRPTSKWAAKTAAQVKEEIRDTIEPSIEMVDDGMWHFDSKEESLVELEKLGRKYASQAAPNGSRGLDSFIPIDLQGWKYVPNAGPAEALLRGWVPKGVRLEVRFENNPRALGHWWSQHWTMVLFAGKYTSELWDMKAKFKALTQTVRHETQHFAQSALKAIKSLPGAAGSVPSNIRRHDPTGPNESSIPMEEGDPWGRIKHELRDVEFQTRLADEVERFLEPLDPNPIETRLNSTKPKGLAVEHWDKYIRHFTAAQNIRAPMQEGRPVWPWNKSHWFTYLKANDRQRWQEATKRFIGELDRRGILRQIKKEKARMPTAPSRHPAWGLSVMGYWSRRGDKRVPWATLRDDYERFTDSLSVSQLVLHKQLVTANGDKWYWVVPRLQEWDGVEDLGGSRPPYKDHPKMPRPHRF